MSTSADGAPATSVQERMWFAERLEPGDGLYNVPYAWRVQGHLSARTLERAVAVLIERHEILRTTFAERDGRLHQEVGEPWTPVLDRVDLRDAAGDALAGWLRDSARRPFALDGGPLLRIGLADLDRHEQVVFLCAHHLIWDATSTELFLRELRDCYDAADTGPADTDAGTDNGTDAGTDASTDGGTDGWLAEAPPLPTVVLGQAGRTPDATALVFEDTTLSYAELSRRAQAVAGALAARGLGRGDLVGVYADRSADLVPALLGVLLSGAAYVPLDPIYPAERIAGMLADSRAALLIADQPPGPEIAATGVATAGLDEVLAAAPIDRPVPVTGADIAYVIYTSGSTGTPKGVQVTHRGLANLLRSMAIRPGFGDRDTMLALTTVCFDIAALELFLPLTTGGTVEVAPAEVARDGDLLVRHLARSRPTHLQATPATWRMLLAAGWAGDEDLTVLCGGEALPRPLADELRLRARAVWNLYGPTETTIWSTAGLVPATGPVTLGRPVTNTTLHVLDEDLRPAGPGRPGELWIGGDGVAAGYLRRPELTAERFRPDPADPDGGVLYRTGDLVRTLPDGELEYVNRVDNQIKLHGFRLEPGEIESMLRERPEVSDAVVLLDGVDTLAAYLVCAGPPPAAADLRAFLGTRLPGYMVPAAFRIVDHFPLTGNGKVDRNALREQGGDAPSAPRREPATATGRLLAGIFAEVLDGPEPGGDESFFELGGHSLLVPRLTGAIAARTGIRISVRDLYERPRPDDLAAHLDALAAEQAGGQPGPQPAEDRPAAAAGPPATSMQEQMWLAEQMDATGPAYNVPLAWRITGELDPDALRAALGALVERHEILRTAFRQHDGRLHQVVTEPWTPELPAGSLDLDALTDQEATTPFDLGSGRLLRAHLLATGPAEHVLLLCFHHIAFDAQSVPVLERDLDHLYARALGRSTAELAPPVQFAQAAPEPDPDGLDHWADHLAGAPETLDLDAPPRRPEPHGAVPVPFAPDFARRTAALCDEHRVSWYMVAVAAVAAWLHRTDGGADVTFGLPMANRDDGLDDVLGPCLNTVVLRSRAEAGATFADLLADVRDSMLDAFDHQSVPLPDVLSRLVPHRRPGRTPYLDVMLNLVSVPHGGRPLGAATMTALPFDRWQHESKFGLTVTFVDDDGALGAVLSYRGDRHPAARVRRLADRLGRVLDRLADRADAPLAELVPSGTPQFRDFALAQAQERDSAAGQEGLREWTRRLAGAPAFTALTPPLRAEPSGSVPIPLSAGALEGLGRVRAEHGLSWFMVAATGLAALLHRWTGQEDVTFGCPVADREEFPDLLGPCLNTVVLRSECDAGTTVLDLSLAMRETVLSAFELDRVPFEDVVGALRPPRRPGWTPYVDVTLAATAAGAAGASLGGARLSPVELDHAGAGYAGKFGLTVGFEEVGGRLRGTVLHRGDRVTGAEVERMAAWLGRFLESFAGLVERPVGTLDLLGEAERAELAGFERTAAAGPPTTVPALFAQRCAAQPDAPAIRSDRGVLSYAELDLRAEALAAVLRPLTGGDRPVVALLLPRGPELVTAMLAAWKAGAAYCPIDPVYPQARTEFIVSDVGACAVVTDGPAEIGDAVVVDVGAVPERPADGPAAAPPGPDATAYVLYTSGTTGEPKGVAYSHGSLAHVTRWQVDTFGVGPADRVSQIHSVAFDMTEYEVWPALCGGAQLLPYERPVVVPELVAWLGEQEVTLFYTPTPLAEALWTAGTAPESLRWLFFAGSPLTTAPPPAPYGICDAYGPTETYITTTHVVDAAGATVLNCVGRPVDGVEVYVLDAAGQRVPVGMPGEMFVGGATVAQGYWGRDDLTRDRFSDRDPDGRPGWVYRTGDRARWLPDGTLEYLGRLDRQLKIRGYRIEPAEIETQLLADPLVQQAVVRGFPGEAAALVAYLVAPPGGTPDSATVLARLTSRLPDFMVPQAVVWLPALPLNHRGKLDPDALPEPSRADRVGATEWTAPESETEQRIAGVWSAVLGLDSVGVHDNFFDLGGNSLLLGTLHARLESELGMTLPIARLFEHPTVHALARSLAAGPDPGPAAATDDVRDRAERAQRARRTRPTRPGRSGRAA